MWFLVTEFWKRKFGGRITNDVCVHVIYIYTCLFYIERLLYTRDKVTGFKVETSNPTGFLEKQISSE